MIKIKKKTKKNIIQTDNVLAYNLQQDDTINFNRILFCLIIYNRHP